MCKSLRGGRWGNVHLSPNGADLCQELLFGWFDCGGMQTKEGSPLAWRILMGGWDSDVEETRSIERLVN